jgi:hypothetical protein
MAIDLKGMDYAFQGQPFVHVAAKTTLDGTSLDYAFQAQPFYFGAGSVLTESELSSTSSATVSFVGSAGFLTTLSTTGESTASFDSDYLSSATEFTMAGISAVAFAGAYYFGTTLSSNGTSTVSFDSDYRIGATTFSSEGVSEGTFVGCAEKKSALSSAGTSTISFVSGSEKYASFSSVGTSQATFAIMAVQTGGQPDIGAHEYQGITSTIDVTQVVLECMRDGQVGADITSVVLEVMRGYPTYSPTHNRKPRRFRYLW